MRVFTVLGPSHSGKSTLVEALMALEDQNTVSLDIAGAGRVSTFGFMEDDWAVIDIAGGADNLSPVGPALAASDAAVLCVPAEAEAAVLAAPYFRMIEEAGVPCFLFINRVDVAADRISAVVAALQTYCRHGIILRQVPMREDGRIVGAVDLISERAWEYHDGAASSLVELPKDIAQREKEARTELLEALADFDDALLEQLIEDQQPMPSDVYEVASKVLQHHDLVPTLMGSATHRNGIMRLMKSLRHEAPAYDVARDRLAETGASPLAVGAMADHVKHLGKTILVRALGEGVGNGQPLGGDTVGSITGLDAKSPLPKLVPGAIGLAMKSDHLCLGDFYEAGASQPLPAWARPHAPAYHRILEPAHEKDEARLSSALERLAEIDAGLEVQQDPQTGHAVLCAQGQLHFRRAAAKLTEGFGVGVVEENVPPAYRETIRRKAACHHRHRKQSGGAGQFADVEIELRPGARGSGFHFDDLIKGGSIPRNYIPSVEAGAREALQEGPGGFPVVDVAVTLMDGKHHSVDSSDHAFRTAGKNAMREAMAEAGQVALEPIAEVQVHVPSVFAGGLVPIISGMKGQVMGFEGHPTAAGWDVFKAQLPMAALDDLQNALGSAARGTAWFVAEFDHYTEVRADELVRAPA